MSRPRPGIFMSAPTQVKTGPLIETSRQAKRTPVNDLHPLRVCMLTTSYPRYTGDAAGNFVSALAEYLQQHRDCDVEVFAPSTAERTTPDRERLNGVKVRRLRYFWPRRLQRLAYGAGIPWNMRESRIALASIPFFLSSYLVKLLTTAGRFHLIHAHWGVLGALAVATQRIHRRPVVVTIHGSDLRTQNKLIKAFTRYAIARADAVVTPSTEFHQWCCALRPADWSCRFLANGVDMPSAQMLETKLNRPLAEAPRLVTVGRLIAERRHDLLLRAFAEVVKRHPAARLMIVGDGPQRAPLEAMIAELGLGKSVEMAGAVDHSAVATYLLASDLYVSPTTIENFGTAVVEAAAHGLPAVTTRVGFPAELVLDGQTGKVVEPADQHALQAAILDMLADPQRLRQSGRAALARFQDLGLSWAACTERLIDVYRRCIARCSGSASRG
jgi:glycosyltransferase involved in cell wall biosynthesis